MFLHIPLPPCHCRCRFRYTGRHRCRVYSPITFRIGCENHEYYRTNPHRNIFATRQNFHTPLDQQRSPTQTTWHRHYRRPPPYLGGLCQCLFQHHGQPPATIYSHHCHPVPLISRIYHRYTWWLVLYNATRRVMRIPLRCQGVRGRQVAVVEGEVPSAGWVAGKALRCVRRRT